MLDFEIEVNVMTLAYAAKLGLKVRKTYIRVQKIDGSLLKTYSIVIADFQVLDKLGYSCFFQKIFLSAEISMKMVLSMPFIIFNNANV